MKRLALLALLALLTIAAAALAALPVGGEIAVNTTTASTQEDPAIGIDGGGAFTVAWQSDNGGQDGIGLRRFAADGTPLSSEVLFDNAEDEDDVAVATAANGNGVVVYDSVIAADGEEVRARLFAASPFSVGATEIEVNSETPGDQEQAAVAMDADGDFVVAWLNPDDGDGEGVNAQRFDETGAPQGGEIEVNTELADDQKRPSVAMDAAGNFVIAWESDAQDDVDGSEGVYAQRFNAAGAPQGGEMAVNQTTAGDQQRPAVAMDSDGDFVIAWQGNGPGDADGVFVRRYNAAGTPGTDDLRANETTDGSQGDRPAVAMDSDGDFAVVWDRNGPGDADGVFVRDFTAAGAPLAGELLVNSSTAEEQTRPVVVADSDGDMVVAWQTGAVGATDVFARRFARSTPAVPGPGPSPGPGPGPGPAGPVISGLKLKAGPKGVSASVLCLADRCNVTGTGAVLVPGKALAAKTFPLRSARKTLTQGQRGKLTLKLTGKARKAVVRALKQRRYRRKVKARVKVTGADVGRTTTVLRKTARFGPPT